jgi:2-polyprenyl-3-methyl-5-hydroxy-6-metoxy-1,4-benzoquinol methylase
VERALTKIVTGLLELVPHVLGKSAHPFEGRLAAELLPPFSAWDHDDWRRAVALWRLHGAPSIYRLPPRNCPACASTNHQCIFHAYDGYPFNECQECGAWFVPYCVNQNTFTQFFQQCPEAVEILARKIAHRSTHHNRLSDIERLVSNLRHFEPLMTKELISRHYLDVGCGVGHSLEAAGTLGFHPCGIEVNPQAVAMARGRGFAVSTESHQLGERTFGLLSFWETLEHIDNPKNVLGDTLRYLETRGLVVITVPNLNAPPVRLMRGDCPWVFGGFHAAGHINFFHPSSLDHLLDAVGLTAIYRDGQYGNNWLETVSYLLGKNRGARDYLANGPQDTRLSAPVRRIINALGPVCSIVERVALTAPILKVIACRKGEELYFNEGIQELRKERCRAIRSESRMQWLAWNREDCQRPTMARSRATNGIRLFCFSCIRLLRKLQMQVRKQVFGLAKLLPQSPQRRK